MKAEGPKAAQRLAAEEGRRFVAAVMTKLGLSNADAASVAELMILADLRGSDGHGIFRLPQYATRIRAGGIKARPEMRILEEADATALLDGGNGMGHLVVKRGAEIAIAKAKQCGVAWVGIRGSNHAGAAQLYAMMPLKHDMIGIYFAVASANHMAPWGGVELLLGTNPVAIAVPAMEEAPVVLDMATTLASYGKVKLKALAGEDLPLGWMIDREGQPLTDSKRSAQGLLMPLGGYKGYGLALMIALLAGTLNGAKSGRDVIDFNADQRTATNTGQAIMALDVARFGPVDAFKRQVDAAVRELRQSERMKSVDAIHVPGSRGHAHFIERSKAGIPISPELRANLEKLAAEIGVAPPRLG